MLLPKPKRIVDEDYLEFIKRRSCIICGKAPPSDAHHVRTRGAGGSDYEATSLCRQHHSEVHAIGRKTFQKKYNIDFRDVIIKNLIAYISKE